MFPHEKASLPSVEGLTPPSNVARFDLNEHLEDGDREI